MKRAISVAVLGLVLAGCTGDDVNLNVRVAIPADVRTIAAGRLYLSLWSYDRHVADAPPTLIDRARASFIHTAGERTLVLMHVGGHVSGGWRHYITVEGCEGPDAVLWDGIQGVEAPRVVDMQLRTTPTECRGDDAMLQPAPPIDLLHVHEP